MQEINLYQPVSKGVRGMLSASSTGTVFAIVGATLLGLWGFGWWQLDKLNDAVQVVRNQQQAQAAMVAAQGPQLDALTDEELEALITQLANSVDSKSRALAILGDETSGRAKGFSARLRAFGTRHIDGIWLDRLTFGSNVASVSVSGSTNSPESVPLYLRSLAADPALKGGQIDDFIIEKPSHRKAPGAGRLTFKAGHRGLLVPVADAKDDAANGEKS
jgi:hypothetical protein